MHEGYSLVSKGLWVFACSGTISAILGYLDLYGTVLLAKYFDLRVDKGYGSVCYRDSYCTPGENVCTG